LTTELIIAPPATGKTETCIQRIQSLCRDRPLSKVWVIVPDRLQAAAFRRRLATAGGAMGVQVGRFPDLFKSILARAGSFRPLASMPLINRVIREVVDSAVADDAIPYFAPIQPFPGFIISLRDSFAELKRAMVTPAHFADFTNTGSAAQRDLALLYLRYQEKLGSLNWADAEDVILQAAQVLEQDPSAATEIDLLIVDGFDSFNRSQHTLLTQLTARVKQLVVTFPGVGASTRPAHRRFTESIERLIDELSPQITDLEKPPFLPPVLSDLEKHLFDSGNITPVSSADPVLLEARSPAEESREAIRWIKKLVVRENLPLSACVIFTPNAEIYNPLLHSAAAEFGVPIRFTVDEALESSPAVNALLNLLALKLRKYNSHYLINIMRSPYFDFSVDRETVDTFEMISRVGQVVEGRDQWEEVWERLAASSSKNEQNLVDEENSPALPRGEDALQLCRILRGVFDLITPPTGKRNLSAWITWLEDLLERLRFYELAESEQDQVACAAFRDILRALLLSETVAGADQEEFERFLVDLQSAVEGEGFRESNFTGQPALLVGRFTEARGSRFQAVALLGLSEGSFPVNERPDPFLGEELRADLGLEPRLEREQAGLFYQAVTRADRYLLITRPYLSDDGEEWEESAYWKAVASLLDEHALEKVRPDALRPLVDMASTHELLFSAVRRQCLPQAYSFLLPRWQDLQHSNLVLKARRAKSAEGPFEGLAEALVPVMAQRYSLDRVWSASRFESYGLCAFQFYVGNALKLEPRSLPGLGLDAAQIGSLLHKILELTYRHAGNPRDLTALLDLLRQTAEEVFKTAPKEIGFRPSNLWQIEQAQWLEKLEENITALAEDTDWQPIGYEAKFGLEGAQPLRIDLGDEILTMHGVIDRVDRNSQGQLRVIDYKTGSAHMSKNDLQLGYRLQLPIYALAARDALDLGLPVEGFYWKLLSAEPSSLKLSTFSIEDAVGIETAITVGIAHLSRILKGIRDAEFMPEPPDGGCASYCPAAAWCWRFEPGW